MKSQVILIAVFAIAIGSSSAGALTSSLNGDVNDVVALLESTINDVSGIVIDLADDIATRISAALALIIEARTKIENAGLPGAAANPVGLTQVQGAANEVSQSGQKVVWGVTNAGTPTDFNKNVVSFEDSASNLLTTTSSYIV